MFFPSCANRLCFQGGKMRLAWSNQDESATFLTAKPPVKTFLLMTQLRRQRRQSSTEHSPGQKALSAILPQRWARVVKPKSFSVQPKDVAVVALQRKKGSVCLIWGRSRFALHHSWQAWELLLPSLLWSGTCWASVAAKCSREARTFLAATCPADGELHLGSWRG